MEELLTIYETALYLRVSESTVRRMVKDGRIPATRIGRQWRVSRAALADLVQSEPDPAADFFLGGLSADERVEARAQALKARAARAKRKAESYEHCRIPDWTGTGGMVQFWVNDDGTFEVEDGRFSDKDIREGIERLLLRRKP